MRAPSAFAFVLTMTASSLAHADSKDPDPDLTCPLSTVPMHEEHVPANVPALVVFDREATTGSNLNPELAFGPLRSASGAFIALDQQRDAASGGLFLRPKEPLVAGESYALAIEKRCPNATKPFDKGPQTFDLNVIADPPSLFPTTIGTARNLGLDDDGDANVEVTLSPELAAFHAVAGIEIELNRKPASMGRRYGNLPYENGVTRFQVPRVSCSDDQLDGNVHPIQVLVKAHIAGVPDDPEPLGLEAPVRCEKRVSFAETPSFPQPNAASVDRGCAVGRRGGERQWLYIACILGPLALLRRRRLCLRPASSRVTSTSGTRARTSGRR